jgi:predicted nucleotidyltransferase
MRLSAIEIEKIKSVFPELAPGDYELKLFGSRLNDQARGGDIDLLLIVSSQKLEEFRKLKYHFIDALHEKLGERKIDLLIVSPEMILNDEFLQSVGGGVTL